MSFLHLSLLAGLAAIAVPVMLHLFGQRQPQLIDFPALRFVRETSQEQSTSWQLRHMLLLLLRILIFAAMAFALARPRVHSATLGSVLGISALSLCAVLASIAAAVAYATKRPASVWGISLLLALVLWGTAGFWAFRSLASGPVVPAADQSAPVATAIIVDNGPTMTYRSDNQIRLDVAKEFALWILGELPGDSRVGVLSGAPVGSLALDPATAKAQVKLIEPRGAHVDLLARIRVAMELVIANDLERKEIYVISDLMDQAWLTAEPELKTLLDEYRDEVLLQIVDVGKLDTSNWQLSDVAPSSESVAVGSDVNFEVAVNPPRQDAGQNSASTSVSIELLQEEIDPLLPIVRNNKLETPQTKVVDRRVLDFDNESPQKVTLTATELEIGTHHFTVRIDKEDPLPIDNQRYISITAQEQSPTLVIAGDAALGKILRLIVDTSASQSEQINYSQISTVDPNRFAIICLLDPPPLSAKDVSLLKDHVVAGGGLFLILGPELGTPAQIAGNAINGLLPGKISGIASRDRSNRSQFFVPTAPSHPIFSELVNEDISWQEWPVFRSWNFSPLNAGTEQLISLNERSLPIMLSQNVGRGQIVTLCTPIPQRDAQGDALWNELWIGDNYWPSWALMLGTFRALSGANSTSSNHAIGVPVSLPNDTQVWPRRYDLFLPNAEILPVEAAEDVLTLGSFEQVGQYRLRGTRGDPIVRGFSINAPAADTTLNRIDTETLETHLGPENYKLAITRDQLESSVGQARFGRELYPLLMVLVAGLFLAEQAMANRFYKIKFPRGKEART